MWLLESNICQQNWLLGSVSLGFLLFSEAKKGHRIVTRPTNIPLERIFKITIYDQKPFAFRREANKSLIPGTYKTRTVENKSLSSEQPSGYPFFEEPILYESSEGANTLTLYFTQYKPKPVRLVSFICIYIYTYVTCTFRLTPFN